MSRQGTGQAPQPHTCSETGDRALPPGQPFLDTAAWTQARLADSVTDCSWDSVRGQDGPGDPGRPGHWVCCLNSSTWRRLPCGQVTLHLQLPLPNLPGPPPPRPVTPPGTTSQHQEPAPISAGAQPSYLSSLLSPHPPPGILTGLAVSPLPSPQPWWPESPAQRTSGQAPPTGGSLRPGRPFSVRSCIKNKGSQFNLNFR